MDDSTLSAAPHRRLNVLTGEWLLVSPHRTQRPWQGQLEATRVEQRPAYDPTCFMSQQPACRWSTHAQLYLDICVRQ